MIGLVRPPRRIDGSVVVVVGATSGVGQATAVALARNGARLVIAARDAGALDAVARRCRSEHATVVVVPTDIREPDQIDRLHDEAIAAFGAIDTWINVAATLVVGELPSQPVADIRDIVATNVLGTTMASRAALQRFVLQERGVLINMSSLLGIAPNPVVPTYSMTKFAVRGLSLGLHEWTAAHPGIRVCTIMPGPIDTPMFHRATNLTGRPIRAIPPAASAERVAATVLRSVRRPRRQRTVGATGAAIVIGHHVSPRLTETIVARCAAFLIFGRNRTSDEDGRDRAEVSGGYRRVELRRRIGDAVGRRLSGPRRSARRGASGTAATPVVPLREVAG